MWSESHNRSWSVGVAMMNAGPDDAGIHVEWRGRDSPVELSASLVTTGSSSTVEDNVNMGLLMIRRLG